jgi:hypothetical protein
MCRHTSTKCSGGSSSVGSRQGEGATRARACLNTRLGILSLTGIATPATARTNHRPLTNFTTDNFIRFPYSTPSPWNICVKDNCALPYSKKRWARVITMSKYACPCAWPSTLMTFKPMDFNENWYSRVVMHCLRTFQLPISNQTSMFVTRISEVRTLATNESLSGTKWLQREFDCIFWFTAITN